VRTSNERVSVLSHHGSETWDVWSYYVCMGLGHIGRKAEVIEDERRRVLYVMTI
jgi:hypothetical protein